MRRRNPIPGIKTAALLTLLGVGSAGAIMWYRDPTAPLSDALAPAVQALFAAIVAAFGITQMLIARDAMQAARRSVVATNEQTEVMRLEMHRAEQDAAQRSWEADEALGVARQQRLDSLAPQAVLLCSPGPYLENDQADDIYEKLIGDDGARFSYEEAATASLTLVVPVRIYNYGSSPVYWERVDDGPNPNRQERGVAWPSPTFRSEENSLTLSVSYTVQRWKHWAETAAQAGGESPLFMQMKVSMFGASPLASDVHVLKVHLPHIEDTGDGLRVAATIAHDKVGEIER